MGKGAYLRGGGGASRPPASAPPKWLVLGVNNICNLRCRMCDVGTGARETVFHENLAGTDTAHMPLELFRKVASQARRFFPGVKLGYAFTEPLIYRYFDRSLEIARENRLDVSITTNALELKRKAGVVAEYGVKNLFVSLDGPGAVHNYIRGRDDSFERAVEGIEALLQYPKRPSVSVFCVVTEWNIGHLEKFTRFFHGYPLERMGFLHTNFTSRKIAEIHNARHGDRYRATHSNIEKVDPGNMDLDLLHREIWRLRARAHPFPVTFSPELETREMLDVFYRSPHIPIGVKCCDINDNIMIKPDGNVIPAHGRCFNVTIGNLYEKDLLSIWEAPELSRFRDDLTEAGGLFPACSRCCSAFK